VSSPARAGYLRGVLCEPAPALTDLLLGLVTLALGMTLRGRPDVHRYWRLTYWWSGAAAVAGFFHHGWVTCSDTWAGPSWAVISGMVVIAISYLLAATVIEVLGPGRGRVFWVLRSASLLAYAVVALTGNAGVGAILLCEGLTMIAILALWFRAAAQGMPLARQVCVALLASGAAAVFRAMPHEWAEVVGLDPISLYHLAQIPGFVLLTRALLGRAPEAETRRAPYPASDVSA
jgi:hypothetical protein